jgi:hypothetical protein
VLPVFCDLVKDISSPVCVSPEIKRMLPKWRRRIATTASQLYLCDPTQGPTHNTEMSAEMIRLTWQTHLQWRILVFMFWPSTVPVP